MASRFSQLRSSPITIREPDYMQALVDTAGKWLDPEFINRIQQQEEDRKQQIVENTQQNRVIANQTMSAEAVKQNAETNEYKTLTEFWQGELGRARPTERADMMKAANLDFKEKLPEESPPFSQSMINKETTYGTKYGEFTDVLTGKTPQTLDNIDKAITFYLQDPVKNAPLITQLRAQSKEIKKSDSNKAALELMSGLVTDLMPAGSKIIQTMDDFKSKDLVADAMITAASGVLSTAITTQTARMKAGVLANKLTMEQYKDYADSLVKVGTEMMDINPEAGQEYISTGHAILQGLPLMRIGARTGGPDPTKGLGFRTPEEVEAGYRTAQAEYKDLFQDKIKGFEGKGEKTVVNIAGENMFGPEFLRRQSMGDFEVEEILNATIMDRDLPGGKVLAGNLLQGEKVYNKRGEEHIVTKFRKVTPPTTYIGAGQVSVVGPGPFSGLLPSKNLITLKDSKTGKPVKFKKGKKGEKYKDITELTLSEFNSLYSLEKPGRTFKTYKEEKKILSPEEYPARKAEAEEYAVSLGYTIDMDSGEKNEILAKVYEKYPELKSR